MDREWLNVFRVTIMVELVIIFVFMIVVYILAAHYDIMELIINYSKQHEKWQMDELITVSVFSVFALAFFSTRRWQDTLVSERKLKQSNETLQKALDDIQTLHGIIPICAYCKKVRDDRNSWHQLEVYVSEHSDAKFSHGACPHCYAEQMEILKNTTKTAHLTNSDNSTAIPPNSQPES